MSFSAEKTDHESLADGLLFWWHIFASRGSHESRACAIGVQPPIMNGNFIGYSKSRVFLVQCCLSQMHHAPSPGTSVDRIQGKKFRVLSGCGPGFSSEQRHFRRRRWRECPQGSGKDLWKRRAQPKCSCPMTNIHLTVRTTHYVSQ